MSKLIPLTRGLSAIVDDEDYDFLMQWEWHARPSKNDLMYACRTSRRIDGVKRFSIWMHREILGIGAPPPYVDHKNHNGLDNRRRNIRVCSCSQNLYNQRCRAGRKKGAYFVKSRGVWRACITINGRIILLGTFKDEESAALAYDDAAIKYIGRFSSLNFPERIGNDK